MNPNSNNTTKAHETDIAQPPGAYDNQRYPDQNLVYPLQGQQPVSRGQHTNAHETDIAQTSGAYDNQRYSDQNPVYPPQGQQPASRGQHTTDTNVHELGTAQPPGPYDNQRYPDHNPAYPLGGQQPAPIGQHDRNYRYGSTVGQDGTQINQGQYGVAPHIGQHDPNYGYGRTVGQDGTQINQGKYGAAPPTYLTDAPGAGGQRVDDPDAPVNSNKSGSTTSHPSLTRMIGKVESAIGSLIDSESLRTKGLQKEQAANAVNIQNLEIAQAERLEKEALMHRERAVGQGAHPANLILGGPQRAYK